MDLERIKFRMVVEVVLWKIYVKFNLIRDFRDVVSHLYVPDKFDIEELKVYCVNNSI